MQILLSPAKKQIIYPITSDLSTIDTPIFKDESVMLVKLLQSLSTHELSNLMKISDTLAQLNYERYKNFDLAFNKKNNLTHAIWSFQGDAYQHLNVQDFSKEDMSFCQNHLLLLSGLYGILKPLDLIQPYRLEMKTPLKNIKGNNLYTFWGDKISHYINNKMKQQRDTYIINLASSEYSKAICRDTLSYQVIDIEFKEMKNNKLISIGINAKKARGAMARYIIKNQLNDVEKIKHFTEYNYKFNPNISTTTKYFFSR